MAGGRPTIRSRAMEDRIISAIEEGATILELGQRDGMPSWETMRRWLRDDAEFSARYARARETAGEAFEAQIMVEMAKARCKDTAAAARVKVDALKWLAAKRQPKVYGDRLDLNHSGGFDLKALPDDRVELRLADLIGKAGIAGLVGGEATPRLSPPDRDDVPDPGASEA